MRRPARKLFQTLCVAALAIAGAASGNRSPIPVAFPEIPPPENGSAQDRAAATDDRLQVLTSSGHAVGFDEDGYTVASLDHALPVRFVGAQRVRPLADNTATAASGKAAPLERISYRQLWPGIDLSYDTGGGILRSTYQLAPGASPASIELAYNVPLSIAFDGSLGLRFERGTLRETAPVAWQVVEGERVAVTVAFEKRGQDRLGFTLGDYDPDIPLTVDPTLSWHKFLGSPDRDWASALALDGAGNLFVAGGSWVSWGTPLTPHSGGYDMVVAKLDATTGQLQWHTFLGGPTVSNSATALVLDQARNVFVIGSSSGNWGTPVNPHSGG